MNLRPQDVVLVLKLLVCDSKPWSYAKLGEELAMSASHAFESVARAEAAHLVLVPPPRVGRIEGLSLLAKPDRGNLTEFLSHGVKYAFPVERGGPTRGLPTAEAASPLKAHFAQDFQLPPVWPHPEGPVRGIAFSPLYKNVPEAASHDSKLYELLALVDAIREGRAREREIAIRELSTRIDFR
jgi:hypothetical protein